MPKNGSEVPVLYEVLRILEFENGSRVSVAARLCQDEVSAKEAIEELQALFERRKDTIGPALAEVGIVRCMFGTVKRLAPESRILRPVPGLLVPRA